MNLGRLQFAVFPKDSHGFRFALHESRHEKTPALAIMNVRSLPHSIQSVNHMRVAGGRTRLTRRHNLHGRTVQLKVRFADFYLIVRSLTFPEPMDIIQNLWQAANELLSQRLLAGHLSARLLGMGGSGLDGEA